MWVRGVTFYISILSIYYISIIMLLYSATNNWHYIKALYTIQCVFLWLTQSWLIILAFITWINVLEVVLLRWHQNKLLTFSWLKRNISAKYKTVILVSVYNRKCPEVFGVTQKGWNIPLWTTQIGLGDKREMMAFKPPSSGTSHWPADPVHDMDTIYRTT